MRYIKRLVEDDLVAKMAASGGHDVARQGE